MTVQQEARYKTASDRNLVNFLQRGGCKMVNGALAPLNHGRYYDMDLDDLKHHVGVRKKDTTNDTALTGWLNQVHAHAKKAGLVKKEKKVSAPSNPDKGLPESDEKFVRKLQSVTGDVEFPHVKGHDVTEFYAEPVEDSVPEKKINPKKAARQAALEASGTAPGKRVNADAQRAAAMAAKAKRQPRIMTKH